MSSCVFLWYICILHVHKINILSEYNVWPCVYIRSRMIFYKADFFKKTDICNFMAVVESQRWGRYVCLYMCMCTCGHIIHLHLQTYNKVAIMKFFTSQSTFNSYSTFPYKYSITHFVSMKSQFILNFNSTNIHQDI